MGGEVVACNSVIVWPPTRSWCFMTVGYTLFGLAVLATFVLAPPRRRTASDLIGNQPDD